MPMLTDEELNAIEARGEAPLNSFENARDGLETLGADVARLVKELRDEQAVCARWKTEVLLLRKQSSAWADIADGMAAALGDPTTTEHVALAERVRRERDIFAREIAEVGRASLKTSLARPSVLSASSDAT